MLKGRRSKDAACSQAASPVLACGAGDLRLCGALEVRCWGDLQLAAKEAVDATIEGIRQELTYSKPTLHLLCADISSGRQSKLAVARPGKETGPHPVSVWGPCEPRSHLLIISGGRHLCSPDLIRQQSGGGIQQALGPPLGPGLTGCYFLFSFSTSQPSALIRPQLGSSAAGLFFPCPPLSLPPGSSHLVARSADVASNRGGDPRGLQIKRAASGAQAASSFQAARPLGPVFRCGPSGRAPAPLPPTAASPQVVPLSVAVPGCGSRDRGVALPRGHLPPLLPPLVRSASWPGTPAGFIRPRHRFAAAGHRDSACGSHEPPGPQVPIQLVGERIAPPSPSN
ncbi:hypothetical protein NDU88_003230 [Pleurodeles waltl]|uniref:Uncharacterized protein n=1 Tax=Pleurodeles waltl TaxID=8319 RepID=A0AAV7W6A7_PLEWA|nr:hypothetical protein NDU88_003230 [Pleurodeles waltl]